MNDSPRVLGNRYEVGELLGRGGMAEVHLGRDARLGRTVAIKLLRSDLARDPTFQARFRREAQSSAALNHPAIVAVYDTGEEQVVESGGSVFNLPYIVMEHIEGRTLRDVLAEGHHLDVDAALDIITGVLAALEYSHRIGIVHRDIKPANVMLTPVGDVKVMDFGIARAMADASSTMTQTQAVIGTAQYLSPEQARGEQVDTRSDLYSAGCLLYELLTGRPPFVADSPVAVAYQHVREQPIPPSRLIPGIPDSVDRITLHSLAKGRDERYQTAADFRADVEAARGGRQITTGVPAMHGSNATTQYVPVQDPTGTRLAPAVGGVGAGGLLGGDTMNGQPNPYDPYNQGPPNDPYGQQNDYGRRQQREQEPSSNRNVVLAGIATVLVVALVAFFAWMQLKPDDEVVTPTAALENMVGKQGTQAVKELTDLGFTAVTTEEKTSKTTEIDEVTAQNPAPGPALPLETPIVLTIGTGPNTIDVPKVAGKTQDEARDLITGAGLVYGSVSTQDSPKYEKDEVIGTDPGEGESVKRGSTVNVIIASGSVSLPDDLVGKSYQDARDELRELGFKVQRKTEESAEVPENEVILVSPQPGSKVERGSTVTLTVAKAPAEATATPTDTATPTSTATPSVGPTEPGEDNQ